MLDLQFYPSFGALFNKNSELGIAYSEWLMYYNPTTNRMFLDHMHEQFCAEGNGITAAIQDVDAAMCREYCL